MGADRQKGPALPDAAADRRGSHLRVHLRHLVGATALDVAFELCEPWTILFGPSGAGKTTVLRAIAGLTRPDEARIVYGPEQAPDGTLPTVLTDTASHIWVAPHRRRIGFAPQEAALFPHKTVLENVGFSMRHSARKKSERDEATAALDSLLTLFRIQALGAKYPAQLSGGEAQRVNLARAFATAFASAPRTCRLLLLDEPFTGLEQDLRDQIITGVRTWLGQQRIPVLSVTHDVAEAYQLRAEVIKISAGRVVAQGPVQTVLRTERLRLLSQLDSASTAAHSGEPYIAG